MTFEQIKTEVKDRLGYTSTVADTRIGRGINKTYRSVTASIGLRKARYTNASVNVSIGNPEVTFTGVEKIFQVWRLGSGARPILITPVPIERIREAAAGNGDAPNNYAEKSVTANSVTIRLDQTPETAYTLYADVIAEIADLSGSNEPAFPESFHDILVEGTLRDEYRKQEKVQLARDSEVTYQQRLSDLRMFLATSAYMDMQQGLYSVDTPNRINVGGGDSSESLSASALTITGLWTFDRDPSAPFVVSDNSAYVANLFAEGIANITTDRIIGRDTAGTGESEQLTVGGGLEFTGSGGIRVADDGITTAKILNASVTYAKIQDVSATDKVLGRSTAGSGDVEEIACTAAGRALLDDASASAQRTTLGVGTADSPTFASVVVTDDIYDTAWTDYSSSSTVTGWAATPTVTIFYKKVGRLVFVSFIITGTSNATSASFTVPVAAVDMANSSFRFGSNMLFAVDNGSNITAANKCEIAENSSTVQCYPTLAGGTWTGSGTKTVQGTLWYEAAS